MNSTDDDARKAMRQDGGKLKEIQVRLFLSSRAEMQEVIETARQTTMSLMQMQRQTQVAAPIVQPPSLTPQSPPQALPPTNFQAKIQPTISAIPAIPAIPAMPTIPTPLPGLITHQMYQQQIQQQQQQHHSLLPPQQQKLAAQKPTENGYGSYDDRSEDSRRHRRRHRSDSSRSRSRSRSSSPRSRSRGSRRHYSRSERSTSRERERDRRRRVTRTDKSDSNRNGSDKRPSNDVPPNQSFVPNVMAPNTTQMYQPNMPFSANIPPFMLNKNPPLAGMNNPIDSNVMNNLLQQQQPQQPEQMSAFSTNDVRTMNMNMSMQNNPLAFQQQLYNQQQTNNMPAFNTFAQGNAQQPFAAPTIPGQMNMNNSIGGGGGGVGANAGMVQAGNFNPMNITTCVRVRNLCNLTNYSAIRKFFAGILIPNDGIKMINDVDGNRTGQAYIKFARPQSVALAMSRSGQKLGRNAIQIQDLDEKAYEAAVDSFRPPRRTNNSYRDRERGDRDRDRDRERDRDHDRGRYGRNNRDYSSNDDDDDDDDRNSSNRSDNERDNDVMCISDSNDSKEMLPFTTVLIEDLPPFTKEQDIMKMFSSYPLVQIVMAKRSKVFSSYVKFHSADDAKAAVKDTSCHKISFKTVYVSACSEGEYEAARKEFSGELDLDFGIMRPAAEKPVAKQNGSAESSESAIKSPPQTNNATQANADGLNDDGDASGHAITALSLDSIPGVNLSDPRINAAKFPFINNLPTADAKPMERVDPRTKTPVQPVNAMVNYANMLPPQSNMVDQSNIADMCCILIENMEYRTTEDEIIEWVQDRANVTPLRIQLLVNERNQTNGNGFVQFASSEQANAVMDSLDKAQFKSRFVRVALASWQQIQMTLANITQILRENGFEGIDTSGNQPRTRFSNNSTSSNKYPPSNGSSSRFSNGNGSSRGSSRPTNRNGKLIII